MTVLVTAASRHGATQAISHEVARQLRSAGHSACVLDPVEVDTLDGVDAVVLGSAVYHGRWMPEARNLVARLERQLDGRPVWLFSSGPLGEPARPLGAVTDAEKAVRSTHARDHRVFAGRLDLAALSRGERLAARRLHAGDGDYRDWYQIRCWAAELASQIATQTSTDSGPDVRRAGEPDRGPIED
jgi:menaquinone-dependent protoporphyrinogen oxidase